MFRSRQGLLVQMGIGFVLSLALVSCTGKKQAEDIHWNEDACENCHMKMNDRKYGAEVITNHGRIFKFDAMECLLDFVKKNEAILSDIYVVDYFHSELIPVKDAVFVRSHKVHGPMGTNVFATKDSAALKDFAEKDTVQQLNWETLKKEAQSE